MEQGENALQDDVVSEETEIQSQSSVEEVNEVVSEETETPSLIEPEDEEIDFNGEKYRVPKELKNAFMAHSDYTTKSQEVAVTRNDLEQKQQQFQQVVEAQQRNMEGHAQLAAMQSQLSQYDNVDWQKYSADNPQEAQQAFFQYTQLKDSVSTHSQKLQQQEGQALQQQQQIAARQMEQGKAELARDIPGWGQELAQKITNHGESYGFSDSEMKGVVDPRMVRVLHDAFLYRQSVNKATQPDIKTVKPSKKVTSKSTGKPNPEKMTTDEWLKWRNKQVASK